MHLIALHGGKYLSLLITRKIRLCRLVWSILMNFLCDFDRKYFYANFRFENFINLRTISCELLNIIFHLYFLYSLIQQNYSENWWRNDSILLQWRLIPSWSASIWGRSIWHHPNGTSQPLRMSHVSNKNSQKMRLKIEDVRNIKKILNKWSSISIIDQICSIDSHHNFLCSSIFYIKQINLI